MVKTYQRMCCGILVLGLLAAWPATADRVAYEPLEGFPPAFGLVVADTLGDGRFILYDGNTVSIETAVNAGTFDAAATGYLGDPAFIAVAPDGHTCLIGAGGADWVGDPSNDWVWLLDADAPVDAPPTNEFGYVSDGLALLANNYWGVWLDDSHVLLDIGPGWVSELGILDVTTATYRKVVDKGQSSATFVVLDGMVYAMIGYGDGAGEVRSFAVTDLQAVFDDPAYDEATSPLAWDAGVLVGNYPAFTWPSTATAEGWLVLGGHGSQLLFVDPVTGEASGDPVTVGDGPADSVRPAFNPVTGRLLITDTNWGGPPDWIPSAMGHISVHYYTLTLGVDDPAAGTAYANPPASEYREGRVVNVWFHANPGAPEAVYFDSWDGDVADRNAASTTVTMDADKTVTARTRGARDPGVDDAPPFACPGVTGATGGPGAGGFTPLILTAALLAMAAHMRRLAARQS